MWSTRRDSILLPDTTLFPPPLHVKKKLRRATFRRPVLRKSSYFHPSNDILCGPLDDIINEITGDIWCSPLECFEPSLSEWEHPLKASSTWAVTPLPVSRTPSDQPLTIRKNRHSRSTASGSSAGFSMAFSRESSDGKGAKSREVSSSDSPAPWPLLDASTLYTNAPEPSSISEAVGNDLSAAQRALETIVQNTASVAQPQPTKRRPSRMRLFTNSFPRLRRTGTNDTSASHTPSQQTASSTAVSPVVQENDDSCDSDAPTIAAVEAYLRKHARDGNKLGSMMAQLVDRFPGPLENRGEPEDNVVQGVKKPLSAPTIMKPAIRVMPEVKLLTDEEHQEFMVAVEVEGILHNRQALKNPSIDLVFVIDNGYYVTKDCLRRALDCVRTALYDLQRGDRVALYVTHCVHEAITSTVPELMYPLRPFTGDTEEIFGDLLEAIAQCGTQKWEPPRPNPSLGDVLLAVVKNVDDKDIKQGRTHVVLLSPIAGSLHGGSDVVTSLYVHQINPAVLPYRCGEHSREVPCMENCCKDTFINNWDQYQSLSGRIKQLIRYARSEDAAGEIRNVHVKINSAKGCEVIETFGATHFKNIRPGQVYSFFISIRVERSQTEELDLTSGCHFFDPHLDTSKLRDEIRTAKAVGAVKAHLLSLHVMWQDLLHAPDTCMCTEAQLLVIKELGRLGRPLDTSVEVYKRHLFHKVRKLDPESAKQVLEGFAASDPGQKEEVKKVMDHMLKEVQAHEKIQEYEAKSRQKLLSCSGPVRIVAAPHEWLVEKWDAKKNKRKGMAII